MVVKVMMKVVVEVVVKVVVKVVLVTKKKFTYSTVTFVVVMVWW